MLFWILSIKKNKAKKAQTENCVLLSVCRKDGKSCWPQVTHSYSIVLLVVLFWLSVFFSGYEITDANSAHPQFLPPTLRLSLNYEKSCQEERSSCKDRVGGLSCSSLSLLKAFCTPDAFSVPRGTFEIFLLKVGSLLGPGSSSVHHSLIIIPLVDTWWQTHIQHYKSLYRYVYIYSRSQSHNILLTTWKWNMKQQIFQYTNISWT